jgi:hypothetical protein
MYQCKTGDGLPEGHPQERTIDNGQKGGGREIAQGPGSVYFLRGRVDVGLAVTHPIPRGMGCVEMRLSRALQQTGSCLLHCDGQKSPEREIVIISV